MNYVNVRSIFKSNTIWWCLEGGIDNRKLKAWIKNYVQFLATKLFYMQLIYYGHIKVNAIKPTLIRRIIPNKPGFEFSVADRSCYHSTAPKIRPFSTIKLLVFIFPG